jgi:hypothetical protein
MNKQRRAGKGRLRPRFREPCVTVMIGSALLSGDPATLG